MRITRTDPITGRTHQKDLPITHYELIQWASGGKAQALFPTIPPEDREFLISGIPNEEYDSMAAEWEITEYAHEEEEGIVHLYPEEVQEVLKLIKQYNPIKPLRVRFSAAKISS